jgi:DNA repair protein RadC
MYPEKQEIVLFGTDKAQLKPFVPEMKIRMNKGRAFNVNKISSSRDTYEILKRIYGRNLIQENFIVLLLNRANKLIGYYRHTLGTSYSTSADIPMIIGLATKAIAQSIIVSHNHPSGSLIPSESDVNLTHGIKKALDTVSIKLLDHVIFTNDDYYSFADEGVLNGLNGTTMITIENLIQEYPGINQDSLPDVLKQDEFEFIKENIDLYNDDETIKKYINTFVEKLNEVLAKKDTKAKSEEEVKHPSKAAKSKPEKKPKEPEKKQAASDDSAKQVEKLMLEVSFIKRFVRLHGKTIEKSSILSLLNALQKAIVEKRIRKTSIYANEIKNIQNQLIKCYNQMGNTIEINIDEKTLSHYSIIVHSQKAMLSVTYIKQYIGLHGKQDVKEKSKSLLEKIEKAIESGKITSNDPYWNEISEIKSSLESYINDKSKAPAIKESTLNGIMSWLAKRQQKKKIAKYLQKIYETERGLKGTEEEPELNGTESFQVISSTQLPAMQFETIGLQGKYRELIGDPCIGFTAMVFGLPKSGKSTLCIDFARHLAKHHGKVLYVAIEEKFGYTLKEKFERLNAIHPNLIIAEKLPEDLSSFQFVFIDSVSKAKLTTDDLTQLHRQNPRTAFIFIFHTTKDGKFRGKQDFAHDVDVIIEVENGVAKANGRFGIGQTLNVFKLLA